MTRGGAQYGGQAVGTDRSGVGCCGGGVAIASIRHTPAAQCATFARADAQRPFGRLSDCGTIWIMSDVNLVGGTRRQRPSRYGPGRCPFA